MFVFVCSVFANVFYLISFCGVLQFAMRMHVVNLICAALLSKLVRSEANDVLVQGHFVL